MQICYQGKCINIGTTHLANTPPQYIENEDNYEEEEPFLDEIEYQSEEDLEELETYISELITEENPAIFLSEAPHEIIQDHNTGIMNQEQEQEVQNLLKDFQDIFVKSIFKEDQTSNLG